MFYNDTNNSVEEYSYLGYLLEIVYIEYEQVARWQLTKKDINITKKGKLYAPGNLRAIAENPAYKNLVEFWMENSYTLRYSGSDTVTTYLGAMATDIY